MQTIARLRFLALFAAIFPLICLACTSVPAHARAAYHFAQYRGKSPLHALSGSSKTPSPSAMTPAQIKKIYNLPASGGSGTIAIIGAYDDKTIDQDLAAFSRQFGLPACTEASGCLTQHLMAPKEIDNSGWDLETSLDIEWAHAIAPKAKILLIEAATPSGANLLAAVDYAAKQTGLASISMSWGGAEFPEETSLDSHFVSMSGAPFFASSGDTGTGANWPASSPKVIAVGGTSISMIGGIFQNETAWDGSGGGVSMYERESVAQASYAIPKAGGMRAVPDVSYDADPRSGFPIYHAGAWHTVGGTSAGAPQWAAIAAFGSVSLASLYADKQKANAAAYFRDIVSGSNGSCRYFCAARARYDFVTGLGSPQTARF